MLSVTSRLWDATKACSPSGANANSGPKNSRDLFVLTHPRNTLPSSMSEALSIAHLFGCRPLRVGWGFVGLKFPELFLLSACAEHLSSLPVAVGGPLGVVSATARKTSLWKGTLGGEMLDTSTTGLLQ